MFLKKFYLQKSKQQPDNGIICNTFVWIVDNWIYVVCIRRQAFVNLTVKYIFSSLFISLNVIKSVLKVVPVA